MLGIVLGHMGQHQEEARLARERARSLDPLQAMHHALSAQVAFVTRDFSAAIQFARQATIILADFWIGHYQLGQAYEQGGQYELALESLVKSRGVRRRKQQSAVAARVCSCETRPRA